MCKNCQDLSDKHISQFIDTLLIEETKNLTPKMQEKFDDLTYADVESPTIYLGTGTCGLGAGAGKTLKIINSFLADKKIEANIVEVGCIGLCAEEPLMDVQFPGKSRISFKNVTEDKAERILSSVFDDELEKDDVLFQIPTEKNKKWDDVPEMKEVPFFKHQTRWVLKNCGLVNPESIDQYIARGGFKGLAKALRNITPKELCDLVEESGLRGRGGGGFPAGKKWKFALNTPSEQKYFVCNADEGDPGAFMDRAVIEGDPYALVEGLTLASYAIGASKAYIYIRAEYPLAIARLKTAIARAKEYGLLGQNILNSGFNLDMVIKKGAGAFVCGEETALMHSIEGKRGMPRPRPPYPAVSGLFNKPTVINNVETLANVPSVVFNGPQ